MLRLSCFVLPAVLFRLAPKTQTGFGVPTFIAATATAMVHKQRSHPASLLLPVVLVLLLLLLLYLVLESRHRSRQLDKVLQTLSSPTKNR